MHVYVLQQWNVTSMKVIANMILYIKKMNVLSLKFSIYSNEKSKKVVPATNTTTTWVYMWGLCQSHLPHGQKKVV